MEFYPYKKMFEEGLASVMVAHLNVPSLESKPNYPSSISYNVVTNASKNWAFGSYFTDALNMKAVNLGQIDLRAFWRECFIISGRCAFSVRCFKNTDSLFTDSRLASSVKILKFKYPRGLNSVKPIDVKICIKTSIRLKMRR
jgi:hypothetical protein